MLELTVFLFGFSQSLWLDEAVTANVVRNYSVIEIITKFSPSDFHPPLYYIFLKFWTTVFGYSEVALRLPSLIFVLLTAYVLYKISKNYWASLLFVFNPLIVYYSQEAGMYLMVTCLLICAYYFFVNHRLLLFNLFSALSFLTFYGSAFLLLTFYLYLLFKCQFKHQYLLGFGISLVLLFLLLDRQMSVSLASQSLAPNWSSVLGTVNPQNLLLIALKFTSGRISFYPKIVYYLISGLWAVWIFAIFRRRPIYLYFFITPLIVGTIFSLFAPMLQYFRFLYLIPFLSLSLSESRLRHFALAGFIIFSGVYLFNPRFHREDWRSLSQSLPLNSTVHLISSFSDPLTYYRSDLTIVDLRQPLSTDMLSVIPYGEAIYGVNHQQLLTAHSYHQVSTQDFRGLTLETWVKN